MSDIVERLREWGHPDWYYVDTDLLAENQDVRLDAADEIESLRGALREIDALAIRHERGAMGKAQKIARAALNTKESK